MAYNFKNLADVELLNAMPEEANVLVEINGTTRRAPQVQIPEPVDEIALIVGSETLEEVPEGATVLAEVNGQIKRVPSDGLGGGKALIVKSSDFDNAMVSVAGASASAPEVTFTANMTYDEAVSALANCEMRGAYLFANMNGTPITATMFITVLDSTSYVVPCIMMMCEITQLYWTAAGGISTTEPDSAVQPK